MAQIDDVVIRSVRAPVQRCVARTKATWYRPNGGRCPYAAVTVLDGDPLCKLHADKWVQAERPTTTQEGE